MMMILQMKLSRQYLLIRCLILLASASSSPDTNDNAIPNPFNPPKVSGPRSSRFPSIETRVKLYMSNWYAPSCSGYTDGLAKYEYRPAVDNFNWTRLWVEEPSSVVNHSSYELESAIEPDKAFFIEQGTLLDCSIRGDGDEKYNNRIVFRSNMYMYCLDASNLLLPAVKHILMEGGDTQRRLQSSSTTEAADFLASYPPIVMQFGDLKHSHVYRFMNLPHFKKFRSAAVSSAALSKVTEVDCYDKSRDVLDAFHKDDDGNPFLHPIVWKLATRRHYRFLESVLEEDIPWNNKTNMAVFSGQLTGSRDGFQKKMPDEENCMNMRRCRLVYTHGNSSLVYARLTNTRGRLPDVLNGVELVAESVGIGELLKYKGIVMLEGNDVASGLKWSLLSQSVVLMPPPKHTSWAMEELLEPWVHYIPLSESLSDVEEKMQWVVDHDDDARKIAERGSLWMQDLVFHPDAAEDDKLVQEEIIRRYLQHYVPTSEQ